jgi:hypothetical protein
MKYLLFLLNSLTVTSNTVNDDDDQSQLKVDGESCAFKGGMKRVSNCQEGLVCSKSKKLKLFGSKKCIKISKEYEACDLKGTNPQFGTCQEGLNCVEFISSASAEFGVCLQPEKRRRRL